MRTMRMIAGVICVTLILSGAVFALNTGEGKTNHPADEPLGLIVKFKSNANLTLIDGSRSRSTIGLAAVDAVNKRFRVEEMVSLLDNAAQLPEDHPFKKVYTVAIPDEADMLALKAAYEALPEVAYVEFEYPLNLYILKGSGRPDPIIDPIIPGPSDPLYSYQWHLHNAGQLHPHVKRVFGPENDSLVYVQGISGSDIAANPVLVDPPEDADTVVVAIIDTGVDDTHPELQGRMWINSRESSTPNGMDNDNNGYIDDRYGWDFSASDTLLYDDDNDPEDYYGHGTHCAGIVTSITDNAYGIAGICPHVVIMPLKVFPLAVPSKLVKAIIYAADNNADVINLSLGSPYANMAMEEALNYAKERGVVICAAMGNTGDEYISYPAFYDACIAVGATNDSDHVTTFSTYGNHLDVVAPGEAILSLRAANTDMYAEDNEPCIHIINGYYYLADGTSMACPMVVGVAAYLRSVSPGLVPDQVRQIIEQSAEDLTDPYGTGANLPGWDIYSGYGRVDLYAALQLAPLTRAKIEVPEPNEVYAGYVMVSGYTDGPLGTAAYLEWGEGPTPSTWNQITPVSVPASGIIGTWTPYPMAGRYTIRLRVGDNNIDQSTFYLAHQHVADITNPGDQDTVVNEFSVIGSAHCNLFTHYILECKPVTEPLDVWDEIAYSSIPGYEDTLGVWYSHYYDPGDYLLRLRVFTVNIDTAVVVDTALVYVGPFDAGNTWRVDLGATGSIMPNYGDFDGDTYNEIIIGTTNGVKLYNLDGTEKYLETVANLPAGDYRIPIAIGNMDNDGIDDFVAVNQTTFTMYCYRSSSVPYAINLPTFNTLGGAFSASEEEHPYILLQDVNNDGIDEIYLRTMSRSMACEVGQPTPVHSNNNYRQILPLDLNDDGTYEIYAYHMYYGDIMEYTTSFSTTNSVDLTMNGQKFGCYGLSAFDIDDDGELELLAFGSYYDYGFWLYAYDYGFQPVSGFPRSLGFPWEEAPSMPVFGDVDGDGELEYLVTKYDLSTGMIYAWNIDGTPLVPGNGYFLTAPTPAIIDYILLADMNDDNQPEIVAGGHPSIEGILAQQKGEWLWTWDASGQLLEEFSMTLDPDGYTLDRYTPIIGDMGQNGKVNLAIATYAGELVFMNYEDYGFNECASPVTSYRYHRTFDNIGPSFSDDCYAFICGDANNDDVVDTLDCQYILAYLYYGGPAPVPYEAGDVNCNPGITLADYSYLVNYLHYGGPAPCDCGQPKLDDVLPVEFSLRQNYPNPFNPTTTITFSLPTACQVTLDVYNITGQKVATVEDGWLDPGEHVVVWDGQNDSGKPVASGVYFYRIKAGDRIATRKMVLLK
ncbi:MAG: S8 family serine peptidase [candidate division Zixibacteria bacterium]|nr:S8 family serine peptidase [candidate division Zixibacteria bacterium]